MTESECNRMKDFNFLDRAKIIQILLQKRAGKNMAKEIVKRLSSKVFSLAHALTSSLPINEIITTNYDVLFEEASRLRGKSI